jgi:hypothetical protein
VASRGAVGRIRAASHPAASCTHARQDRAASGLGIADPENLPTKFYARLVMAFGLLSPHYRPACFLAWFVGRLIGLSQDTPSTPMTPKEFSGGRLHFMPSLQPFPRLLSGQKARKRKVTARASTKARELHAYLTEYSKLGPAENEVEVDIFGPGFGECILVHAGFN